MRQLKPIKTPLHFDKDIEKAILAFLSETIFKPIFKNITQTKAEIFNSGDIIGHAIRSGKIHFADGIFKGDFNAKLSKEFKKLGLRFDSRVKGYRKSMEKLPVDLQVAITQTASKYQKMARGVMYAIDGISIDINSLDFAAEYGKVIDGIDKEFLKTVGLDIELTKGQREVVTKEFSENLKLYIQDFADEQILILRQDVEKAVFEGKRVETLQKTIADRFGVSVKKAKFLAKQEISLLTSKYKSAKYREAGITKYKWSISNVRTRADHKALNGKIFSFNDPPITNRDTGARNNPGEDFGCECVDIPIIE